MKYSLVVCVLICLMALLLCAVTACTPAQPALAAMSEVTLTEHFLTWQPLPDALFYSVRVLSDAGGFEIPVHDTTYSLSLFAEGRYTLQVRAYVNDVFTDYCAPIEYVLAHDVPTTVGEDENVVLRGSGTYEDPILVYTKAELAAIPVGKREVTTDGVTTSYVNYIRLMADIDLSGEEWISIGTSSKMFEGYFDGNGHTISHLTQTKYNDDTYRYGGLFGNTQGATIVNLNLTDLDIRLGVSTKGFNLGGLIGESKQTIIENCSVSGNIVVNSVQNNTQQASVGLFVGMSWGTDFKRCTAQGSVDVTFARVYAGGFVGIARNTHNEYMADCLSLVDIHTYGTGVESTTDRSPHGTSFATGFGYISSTSGIHNCVWLGHASADTLTGTPAEYYGAGMFANTGKVTQTSQVCNIAFVNCYFDAAALDFIDRATYPTLSAVANRYLVAGAAAQQRGTYAYCVDATNRTNLAAYEALDFDTVWRMTSEGIALAPYTATWHSVTYMIQDEVYRQYWVLDGRTADLPDYTAPDGYTAGGWDYTGDPVTQDIVIRAVLRKD